MRRKSEPSCLLSEAVEREERLETGSTSALGSELRISESDLAGGGGAEKSETPTERKRTLEEIIGQLLMQNREFQRILSRQRHFTPRRRVADTSDEEDDCHPAKPSR